MMKLVGVIASAISLAIFPGAIARAQLGDIGEAAKKGATEAVKKDIAERAGIATPVATGSPTPAASPATASPVHSVSPTVAVSPTAVLSPAGTPSPVTAGDAARGLMDQAGKRAVEEAGKNIVPKVP